MFMFFYMNKEKHTILREQKYCKIQILPCWQVRISSIPRGIFEAVLLLLGRSQCTH